MIIWIAMAVLAAPLAGCGSDRSSTTSVDARVPAFVKDADIPDRDSPGALVLLQSGCLACHLIGTAGNRDPGPSLTHVGTRRDARAITRALVAPQAPMPSYGRLPRAQLRALVEYLSDRK